ncbi:hypothetical protein HPC49_46370 [Pyxidicoccus fallax]|uniref:Uncharacterized protein n=1 Tax=Pyxidicoccus fallax TaxID=394095 RepID=A0A848LMW9_9BACT|nr:hypothetical protein [Pyxidicoccus fallax]NMO19002.1 hypothetical protein [Pyxidicoccus fallax]NPC85602.1 hypothetical protein [Pyxidicoccus fallax]
MRQSEAVHERLLVELRASLCRPTMFFSCAADQELGYLRTLGLLCFVDEREPALEAEREHLERVGARHPSNLINGVTNALRLVMPDVERFPDEAASVYAEVAHRLGYLSVERTVEREALASMHAHFDESRFGRNWTAADVEQVLGTPSFKVGSGEVLGYTSGHPEDAWLFFDIPERGGLVRSVRWYQHSLDAGLRLTPHGRTLTRRGEAQPKFELGPEWKRAHLRLVKNEP